MVSLKELRDAINRRCRECHTRPKTCDDVTCPLWKVRNGEYGLRTTLSGIGKYCLWCMNRQKSEVKLCPSTDCPLHPYRRGTGLLSKAERCDFVVRLPEPVKWSIVAPASQ